MKLKQYITVLHRTCLYWIKESKQQIGCQYKPLLELKNINRQLAKNTLLVHHNVELEALLVYFFATT